MITDNLVQKQDLYCELSANSFTMLETCDVSLILTATHDTHPTDAQYDISNVHKAIYQGLPKSTKSLLEPIRPFVSEVYWVY